MPAKDKQPARVSVTTFLCRDVEPVGQQGGDRGVALSVLTSICSEIGVEQSLQVFISFANAPFGPQVEFIPKAYLVDQHEEKVEGTDLIQGGGAISLGVGDDPLTLILTLNFVPTYYGPYWLRVDLDDVLMAMTPIAVEPPAYTDPGDRTVMVSGAPTYTFLGTVLRAHGEPMTVANVVGDELRPLVVSIMTPDGSLGFDASVKIVASRIEVEVRNVTGGSHSDIGNYVERLVRVLADVHGYIHGEAFDIYISHYVDHQALDTGNWVKPFSVGALDLQRSLETTFEDLLRTVMLEPSERGDEKKVRAVNQLAQALGDVREAIRNPHDTALHCYRAVEDIRQCYVEPSDRKGDEVVAKPSWERMRGQLRFEKSWIKDIESARHGQAHGDSRMLSGAERQEFVRRTRVLVHRFVVSMRAGFRSLPDEFEVLKRQCTEVRHQARASSPGKRRRSEPRRRRQPQPPATSASVRA
ncbi:MAG: hypothetical protein F4Z07_05895 [Dehalococcoidia bacterium]|nr:hypothetical protein [Dehalococcoidia bacterium]